MSCSSADTIKVMTIILSLCVFFASCETKDKNNAVPLTEIAGNDDVLNFMETFAGRGVLSDSSEPLAPEKALTAFKYADDLSVDLVLSEPEISQPVFMNFDHRGRLWVVQYNQYPYPEGLKVTSMDQHVRATFDKIPPPPAGGSRGLDKISFFEDTDGDGVLDKSTDAITGLNIATSVALGRDNIWVLNPPYLIAYPDPDDDGLPDGPAVVHLEGFGLEDTHAVANSLRWGPDGWLYGAQGSTCSANVSSSVSKNIRFNGQAIWRYHPDSRIFEVFAEGGGNTFDIEIDSKGRLYSGDNGIHRGQYYKQGAYYVRNFGKHGELTNRYAFGYLSNMGLKGEQIRFTHAFVKYEGASLPSRYHGRMIAINPLHSYVQLSAFEANGSTFSVVDESRILETKDHWFRPVDITSGPDGAVYIADWYDSRLSHVDPRDTWSKSNGRIYRLRNKNQTPPASAFDLGLYSTDQLLALLSHPDRWFRQEALRQFGDRKDRMVIPALTRLLASDTGQVALEALWALHLSGGFNGPVVESAFKHKNPFVRMWAIRLAGDANSVPSELAQQLTTIASGEQHAEVRSQLAATARRLPGSQAIPILKNLLVSHDDSGDPDIPLQIWWALESKAESDRPLVLNMFDDPEVWNNTIVRYTVLERLMQRYIMAGGDENFSACATLLKKAPSITEARLLVNGLQEGLRGRDMITLSPLLVAALKPYQEALGEQSLSIGLRQGDKQALMKVLEVVKDRKVPARERLSYIRVLGEINAPESVPSLLTLIESNQFSPAMQQAGLLALQRYQVDEIGLRVVKAYPDRLRADPDVRLAALSLFASRPSWAMQLINAIERKKQLGENFIAHTIDKADVPEAIVRQLKLLNDPLVTEATNRLWPHVRLATTEEKNNRIAHVAKLLQSGEGNLSAGQQVFMNSCGTCHRLSGKGGMLGPDLTGYDRTNINDLLVNIVDPGAFVREGYVSYRVTTTDGRALAGTIARRSGTNYELNLHNGEVIVLGADQIKAMDVQPSMMPDNLLEPLTDQQVRDLFSFLMKKE